MQFNLNEAFFAFCVINNCPIKKKEQLVLVTLKDKCLLSLLNRVEKLFVNYTLLAVCLG